MRNIFEDQAREFANIPLIRRNIVASVHIEDKEDEFFWNTILQELHPGKYNFISHSKSQGEKETSGCEQCLKFRPYLSKRFFVCIDSDMRYLLQEPCINAINYICQTYTYSWENHFCEAISLQQRFVRSCPDRAETFDFSVFLLTLSKAVYKPLLLLLYCLKNEKEDINPSMFKKCLPKQCRREELAENGKKLIKRITQNFDQYLSVPLANSIDYEIESEYCKQLNIDEQNAYLHIRGHELFDLVSYIGNLLCRGTFVSFKRDVLMSDLPSQAYWQIKKVKEDVKEVVA